jgi:hypothetical protein
MLVVGLRSEPLIQNGDSVTRFDFNIHHRAILRQILENQVAVMKQMISDGAEYGPDAHISPKLVAKSNELLGEV